MSELSLYEYCKQVENTIEQGRYAEAVAHGKHILKQYPKHVDTYRLLGKAMLEAGQDEYAIDMFRRVLSADPEDMIAWVGLSEVHSKHDELDAAIWYLERAFELAADNKAIEEELRQLYSRRDGVELQKTPLTTGALARLYLKGDLLSRAVNDFRTLLDEHPERVDLRVALAEALWRNEQRLEAAEACQQVLDDLPCCLKANLILGSIWVNSGREEGQTYLRMAEAIDPENKMAQELFRDASPLPARQIHAVPLEYRPQAGEAQPDWMTQAEGVSVGPPLTEKEAMLVDITAALEAQIEIPSWLENISIDGELPASEPPSPSEIPTTAEQVPTWLMTGVSKELVKEQPEEMTEIEEETPEWLTGLGLEPIGEEMDEEGDRETPEWLAEFSADVAEEAPPAPGERREWETPEWLADLGVEADDQAPAPVAPTTEGSRDWLSSLREQFAEEAPMPEEEPAAAMPVPAEIPDWLQELAPPETADVPVAEEAPAWLDSDQLPSGDEALAWLEQLAEGKEEELQAQIRAEAEIRMAEIMGRPAPAEPPAPEIAPEEPAAEPPAPAEIPDWLQELAPPETAAPAAEIEAAPEAMAPLAEEAFGWAEFGEPEAQIEIAPDVEEAAAPEWLDSDQLPSGDEALAWLEQLAEGKEEELQAQIKAEAEVRMAEIMGRPAPAEPPAPEITPEEPAAEPPAPAEIPDWLQELAPPEVAAPAAEIEAAPEAMVPLAEEAFGWTEFGEPEAQPEVAPDVEEAAAPAWLDSDQVPSGDEALAWLEQLAEGKEEELQAQIKAEAEVRMAEIMGRPAPAEPPAPEIALEEPAPAPPDAVGEARLEEALALQFGEAFGWTEFGEPEVQIEPAPAIPPVEAPPPVIEEVVEIVEIEAAAPPPEKAIAPPPAVPTIKAPAGPFADERAYLKANPRDYDAWLALARALWQANEQEESLTAYSRVTRSGKLIEAVIPDLEGYLEQQPDVRVHQALGDAYMKNGQLQEALDLYRRALEIL